MKKQLWIIGIILLVGIVLSVVIYYVNNLNNNTISVLEEDLPQSIYDESLFDNDEIDYGSNLNNNPMRAYLSATEIMMIDNKLKEI